MTAKPVTPLVEMDGAEVIAGNGFAGQDILSVSQFNRENMTYIFEKAQAMRAMVEQDGMSDLLRGNVLTCLFYEPSTRTSASFIAAMERLGGSVLISGQRQWGCKPLPFVMLADNAPGNWIYPARATVKCW